MPGNLSPLIASLSALDADQRSQAAEQLAQLGADAPPAAMALLEIATNLEDNTVVGKSNMLTEPGRVKVVQENGQFLGPLVGRDRLAASQTYFLRVMQQGDTGQKSPWSPWHQPIKTADGATP